MTTAPDADRPNPPYDPDGPAPTDPVGREDDRKAGSKERPRRLNPNPEAPASPMLRDPTGKDLQPPAGGAEKDPFAP